MSDANTPKKAPAPKAMTKAQLKTKLAENSGLTAKQVDTVLESLKTVIVSELRDGAGVFKFLDIIKLSKKHKPATPEKQGINPATKEKITIKAKPARNVVKANPLKQLKDSVV